MMKWNYFLSWNSAPRVWTSFPDILYPALNLDWRFISYMILYMFQCHSPKSSHPLPGGSEDKASACNAGDLGSIPGLGRSPGEGIGNPLQYSCLENPMDRGAWWATVHGVAKSRTWLSNFTHITHTPSPTESKRLFYTSVSLLLSRIQGYHYHLSKSHIYVLVYCIGVFISRLLHSV